MKSLYIGIAVVVVGGIGYLWYNNNKKKKAAADAAALAAKSAADQRAIYQQGLLKMADVMLLTDTAAGQKLKNTVTAGILSDSELKLLYDAWLVFNNMYVGTKSTSQVNTDAFGIMVKYQIKQAAPPSLAPGEVATTLVASTGASPITGKLNFN